MPGHDPFSTLKNKLIENEARRLLEDRLRYHQCDRDEREMQYDGRGIELCFTCDECHEVKMSGYRPEILRPYTQADVDEPIEEDV